MITTGLNMINKEESKIKKNLSFIANSHGRMGIGPQHYGPVVTALFSTLQQLLGDRWTPEVNKAWAVAYSYIVNIMIPVAADAIKEYNKRKEAEMKAAAEGVDREESFHFEEDSHQTNTNNANNTPAHHTPNPSMRMQQFHKEHPNLSTNHSHQQDHNSLISPQPRSQSPPSPSPKDINRPLPTNSSPVQQHESKSQVSSLRGSLAVNNALKLHSPKINNHTSIAVNAHFPKSSIDTINASVMNNFNAGHRGSVMHTQSLQPHNNNELDDNILPSREESKVITAAGSHNENNHNNNNNNNAAAASPLISHRSHNMEAEEAIPPIINQPETDNNNITNNNTNNTENNNSNNETK